MRRRELVGVHKNKSSEWFGPFVSASSSLLDPYLTCYAASLRVPRAISLGLRLTANRKNLPNARNSILPSTFLLVLLDQRFAIDPCLPSLIIFMKRVTALESRMRHQPEKLRSCQRTIMFLTLYIFRVNENCAFITHVFSGEWHAVHRRVTDWCRAEAATSARHLIVAFFHDLKFPGCDGAGWNCCAAVKKRGKAASRGVSARYRNSETRRRDGITLQA